MKTRALRFTIILVLLGIAGYFAYPRIQVLLSPPKISTVVHIACADLRKSCQFELDGQKYQVQTSAMISGAQPFTLILRGKAQNPRASWSMQGMEMGPNDYRLISQSVDVWQAQMALPICSAARHDWVLSIIMDDKQVEINTSSKQQ